MKLIKRPDVDKDNVVWVLDNGYVRLADFMGTDLSVINAARASFQKEHQEWNTSDSENDDRLIAFLLRENEMSPFRHAFLTFEVYAPLMVARQWWKYVVGSDHRDPMTAWNEASRRYVTEEPVFYTPQWRKATEGGKQGSREPMELGESTYWSVQLRAVYDQGEKLYQTMLDCGVAPEQARLALPAYGLYVTWRWSCSLQGLIHFLRQRRERMKAQHEIAEYADAVLMLSQPKFPKSLVEFDIETK